MNKTTLGVLIGNVVEFYDFILFGYLSLYLGAAFFPNFDPYIGLLMTFSVFASGCIVRPIGAFFFGHLGDTFGRKAALKTSIIIASVSTASVGLLPTYETAGLLAPCLLVLCRLSQGFSVCGEETGAATYLIESKPCNQAGYASSLVLSSVYCGLALGSGIVFLTGLLFPESMGSIGWRIPFLLAAPMGYVAYAFRSSAKESPAFSALKQNNRINKTPLTTLLREHKKELIGGVFNCALLAIAIYMFAVYFPSAILSNLSSQSAASALIFFATLLTAISCPIMGKLTDRFGIWKFYKFSILLFVALSPLVLFLATQKSLLSIVIGYIAFGIMCSTLSGTMFAILASSFRDDIRYSGVTVSFNLSMTIFGSTAPIIALWLAHQSSPFSLLPLQLIFVAGIAYLGLLLSRNERKIP